MEFLPGGDLMGLLIWKDTLPENQVKMISAELVLAIEYLHQLGFVHWDLKPDNILIDKEGHFKLSDFGLCAQFKWNSIDQKTKKRLQSTVGTPDYIAPEIFIKSSYNHLVDWWSLGIIIFEMIYGFPPFFCEDTEETYKKIACFEEHLDFPKQPKVSKSTIDFITWLLSNSAKWLGRKGTSEIKEHPFFQGIDWKNIRS